MKFREHDQFYALHEVSQYHKKILWEFEGTLQTLYVQLHQVYSLVDDECYYLLHTCIDAPDVD